MVIKLRYHCSTCGQPFERPKTWAYCSKACEIGRGGWAARQSREDVADRMCEPIFEERLRLGELLERCMPWERDGILAKIRDTEHQEAAVRERVQVEMPVHIEPRQPLQVEHPRDSVEHWAPIIRRESDRFELTMRRGLEAAIRLGKRLLEARRATKYGDFGRMFRGHENPLPDALPFSQSWAAKLMSIGSHEVITNPEMLPKLPAEISTVYVLSRFPADRLREAIASGAVRPSLRPGEARRLLPVAEPAEPEAVDEESESRITELLEPVRSRIAAFACDHPSLMREVRSRLKAMLRAIEATLRGDGASAGTELMGGAQRACMRS